MLLASTSPHWKQSISAKGFFNIPYYPDVEKLRSKQLVRDSTPF
jgi:hypothetical protein